MIKFFIISIILYYIPIANCLSQEVKIQANRNSIDKETIDQIRHTIDFQTEFFFKVFNRKPEDTFNARVFKTEEEFIDYSKKFGDFNPKKDNTIAYFDTETKEILLYVETSDFDQTFSHELAHAVYEHYCTDQATWIDEGLATFLEDVIFIDSTFYFSENQTNRIDKTKKYLLENNSVHDVIESSNFYGNQSDRNYTLSWSIIYYLYGYEFELLKDLIREACNEDFNTYRFFYLNYPGGLEILNSDIRSFYISSNFE